MRDFSYPRGPVTPPACGNPLWVLLPISFPGSPGLSMAQRHWLAHLCSHKHLASATLPSCPASPLALVAATPASTL